MKLAKESLCLPQVSGAQFFWPSKNDFRLMNTPGVELLRLGSRIRVVRTAQGYNQRTFAVTCGLNRSYFGGVERGERNVTFSILCTICAALSCDVAALTEGIPDIASTAALSRGTIHKSDRKPTKMV
jgi:DNA-binding XRE family transcriptional regulator